MNELKTIETGGLIGLLHGQGGDIKLPDPFEREIFLFDTVVAGTSHVENINEIADALEEGEKLNFFREPNNSHDPQAIVIKTAAGVKIGYVPQRDNVVFSRLMDAGKLLYGRVESKERKQTWNRIQVKIYLSD